jgi:hypothetical protein
MLFLQRCYARGAWLVFGGSTAVFCHGFGYRQLPNAPALARVSAV